MTAPSGTRPAPTLVEADALGEPIDARPPRTREELRCATSGRPQMWTSDLREEREMAALECQQCPKRLWCISQALEMSTDLCGVWGGLQDCDLEAFRASGASPVQILAQALDAERIELEEMVGAVLDSSSGDLGVLVPLYHAPAFGGGDLIAGVA